jgi:hypothetical protein
MNILTVLYISGGLAVAAIITWLIIASGAGISEKKSKDYED